MAAPSILVFDFSKTTGIAFGRPGERPVLTSERFAKWEGATMDEAASAVLRWLPGAFATYQPDIVVVEAALPPAASRGQDSARLALGFDFMIGAACHARGTKLHRVHNGTWKSAILGSGNLKSHVAKAKSLQLARGMGLEPKDDNEADAYCIWAYACIHILKFNDQRALDMIAKLQWRLVA